MKIKRYDLHTEIMTSNVDPVQTESPDGEWCRWEDVEKVLAEACAKSLIADRSIKRALDKVREYSRGK